MAAAHPQSIADFEENRVYAALMRGFARMERECVDRSVLFLYPLDYAPAARLPPVLQPYYPTESLTAAEQGYMRVGQAYVVTALSAELPSEGRRPHPCVEFLHRLPATRNPLEGMPYVYRTFGQLLKGREIGMLAHRLLALGLTEITIDGKLREEIDEYRGITRDLTARAGVQAALERMENEAGI